MAVSKRLRYEILRRDGFACRYCGAKADEAELQVDHVLPVALGGGDEAENLVTACADCNAGKSASSPDSEIVANLADDSLRWARAVERAAEIKAADREKRDAYIAAFDECWLTWHFGDDPKNTLDRPPEWEQSIEQFYDAGLDQDTLIRMIKVAMQKPRLAGNKVFRYFCGCCWNAVRERQAVARSLMEAEEGERE